VEASVYAYTADKKLSAEIVNEMGCRAQVLKYVSTIKEEVCVKYVKDHRYVSMENERRRVVYAKWNNIVSLSSHRRNHMHRWPLPHTAPA
tara:strand:- start:9 stop:278 length:270 start_codon:yes stop_codon:yes gene_type:complete